MDNFKKFALLAAAGSVGLMIAVLIFQYIGGLAPCKMCIWQRWPHGIAIVIGIIVMFWPHRVWALLASVIIFIGAGIGVYHAGVEQKWWEGPSSCTGGGLSTEMNLLDLNAPVSLVMCDDIVWQMFGITMAGYNAIFSVVLAVIWFKAYASSSVSQ